MYSTIDNKDKAKRLPHSTLDVERSMFDVQIVASEVTTEPSYHVEITYTGQEFWSWSFPCYGLDVMLPHTDEFAKNEIFAS